MININSNNQTELLTCIRYKEAHSSVGGGSSPYTTSIIVEPIGVQFHERGNFTVDVGVPHSAINWDYIEIPKTLAKRIVDLSKVEADIFIRRANLVDEIFNTTYKQERLHEKAIFFESKRDNEIPTNRGLFVEGVNCAFNEAEGAYAASGPIFMSEGYEAMVEPKTKAIPFTIAKKIEELSKLQQKQNSDVQLITRELRDLRAFDWPEEDLRVKKVPSQNNAIKKIALGTLVGVVGVLVVLNQTNGLNHTSSS